MTRANKLSTIMLVAALGVWGCARGPANQGASAEKARTLETKCAKLEDDYKAVATARDEAKQQATSLEAEAAKLQKEVAQLRAVVKERDAVKQQLTERTTERDALQGQRDALQARCDKMKKGLQSLLGQDDSMTATMPATPVTSSANTGPAVNPTLGGGN
jgi:TolA-binding protein